MFLSFSRAAVARLAEASKEYVSSDVKKKISMHTFHSFCWEILKSHGYLLGTLKSLKVMLPHDEKALSGGVKQNTEEWESWKARRESIFYEEGRVAFDLFIPKTLDILVRSKLIMKLLVQRYPLIIVDEAQDTGHDAWSLIKLISNYVQMICLADLEQQIFDHLEGVGPERVKQIEQSLKPLKIDLGSENNRSPGTNITNFANDILYNRKSLSEYKGVSFLKYNPKQLSSTDIRRALGMLYSTIKKETGEKPKSYALLAPNSKGVSKLTFLLNSGEKPILHKVLFDETEVLLASRFLAFLIEPKIIEKHNDDVIFSLELLADIQRAKGTKGGINESEKYLKWIEIIKKGGTPRNNKLIPALNEVIEVFRKQKFIGNPTKDWVAAKAVLADNKHAFLRSLTRDLDYLIAFNRGKMIASKLLDAWVRFGSYKNARIAVNEAITEETILSGIDDQLGVHVMTIHRSKGKQFDGVIIFRENRKNDNNWESSLVWRDDQYPYNRSRRILRVGITRAKKHVIIVEPAYYKCPILSPFIS